MRKIKNRVITFFRTFYITSVICICLGIAVFGTAKAYENTLATGFGEYKKAVEFKEGTLRILDFNFEIWKK